MDKSNNKRIVVNAIYLYVRMIVVMAVTFYTSRVVLHALGETDYGIYNVVGGIITMLAFLNSALSASTSRFLTYYLGLGDETSLKRTFSATLNLHILLSIIIIIIGETIGLWFFYHQLNIPEDRIQAAFWVYQFSIINACISFIIVPYNASIISHENMSIYAYVGLFEAFSQLAVAFCITYSSIDKLILYAALLVASKCIILVFYLIFANLRYSECKFQLYYEKKIYSQLLSYGVWDLFGGLATAAQGQGISILLNIFFGPIVNAARAIAIQLQSGAMTFINNVMVAFRPQVIKNYACHNISEMFTLTYRAAKISYVLMLAITIPLCFEIDSVLKLWLGPDIPEGTSLFSILILLTTQIESIHSAFLMPYHAVGKIKLGNSLCGTIMILSLPISYLVLKFGASPVSSFIVVLIINFICQILSWGILHKYINFSYKELYFKVYHPCIILSFVSLLTPYIITSHIDSGLIRLAITFIVSDLILLIISWFVILNKEERSIFTNFIKKKLCRK